MGAKRGKRRASRVPARRGAPEQLASGQLRRPDASAGCALTCAIDLAGEVDAASRRLRPSAAALFFTITKAAKNLPRIGGDDLPVSAQRKLHAQAAFPGRVRADDGDQFLLHSVLPRVMLKKRKNISYKDTLPGMRNPAIRLKKALRAARFTCAQPQGNSI